MKDHNVIDTDLHQEIQDDSGLVEMQQAIDEIEKLKNQERLEAPEEEKEAEEKVASESEDEEVISKREKNEDKLWKVKKDKYRALAEKEAIAHENAQLKQMLSESLNSGTYHYGKGAYIDLERAKEYKKRAIEEGNVEALVEADIALTNALHTINDLEKWVNTEEQRRGQSLQSQNVPVGSNEIEHEIASDWLDNHPYLQPTSRIYNPALANKVGGFINYLDANLAKNNQMNAYFSEEYFKTIEDYMASLVNEPPKEQKAPNGGAHVGGVRNSYASGNARSPSSTQMVLTADEKRMCANAGIPEKEWIKYKLEDLKTAKNR